MPYREKSRHKTGLTGAQWKQLFKEAVKYCQVNAPKGDRKKCISEFLHTAEQRLRGGMF